MNPHPTRKYKIKYKVNDNLTLTYSTDDYTIIDAVFIRFYDYKDKLFLTYPLLKCEIREVPR